MVVKVRLSCRLDLILGKAADLSSIDTLADLDKYSPKLIDSGVVGWTTHYTSPRRSLSERKMEFTVKAQVLSAKVDVSMEKEGQDTVRTDNKDEL